MSVKRIFDFLIALPGIILISPVLASFGILKINYPQITQITQGKGQKPDIHRLRRLHRVIIRVSPLLALIFIAVQCII